LLFGLFTPGKAMNMTASCSYCCTGEKRVAVSGKYNHLFNRLHGKKRSSNK